MVVRERDALERLRIDDDPRDARERLCENTSGDAVNAISADSMATLHRLARRFVFIIASPEYARLGETPLLFRALNSFSMLNNST